MTWSLPLKGDNKANLARIELANNIDLSHFDSVSVELKVYRQHTVQSTHLGPSFWQCDYSWSTHLAHIREKLSVTKMKFTFSSYEKNYIIFYRDYIYVAKLPLNDVTTTKKLLTDCFGNFPLMFARE